MRTVVAFDTETELIRPGTQAAELVCITYQIPGDAAGIIHWQDPHVYDLVRYWLETKSILLVGHEVSYDLSVLAALWPDLLPLIFQAYEDDRVTDTKLRQQLLDIAAGCFRGKLGDDNKWIKYDYGLEPLSHRLLNKQLDKDTWRLRYGEFRYIPVDQWPPGAREYPLEDTRSTLNIFLIQEPHAEKWLQDQFRQARAAWALKLCSTWGIRTDPEGVKVFEQQTRQDMEEVRGRLMEYGLVRRDGSRNIKLAQEHMVRACAEAQRPAPLTDGGAPALDKDSCSMVNDDVINDYSEYQTLAKVLANDVPMLLRGTCFPIHSRYDLADTGRSTCTGPNLQALRRKNKD